MKKADHHRHVLGMDCLQAKTGSHHESKKKSVSEFLPSPVLPKVCFGTLEDILDAELWLTCCGSLGSSVCPSIRLCVLPVLLHSWCWGKKIGSLSVSSARCLSAQPSVYLLSCRLHISLFAVRLSLYRQSVRLSAVPFAA